jgi:formate dehydrogenase subunit beta
MYSLPVKKGNASGTINDLLKGLLKDGKVSAVLALQETPSGKSAFPVMVSDPDRMESDVFAPLLPVSTGTMVSRITKIGGSAKRFAVVLRSCELRALTELVKLHQADLGNLTVIGVDCPGTFSMSTYSDLTGAGNRTELVLEGKGDKYMRSACLNCKDPVPENADLIIGIYGAEKEILLDARTERGKDLLEGLDLKVKDGKARQKAVEDVRKLKNDARTAFVKDRSKIKGVEKLTEFFDTCVNCHNCMKACPICYCKECLFESSVFDLEAGKYLARAESKGSYKTPTDSLLFHITRFNHMILSCVQCGLCEQACPSDIPLMDIIIPIAENAQREFDYLPGRDPEEEMPMIVYREDEFQDVGE